MFSPSTVNVARVGWNHLHTTRFGPEGNTLGIPAQYGIQDIPQVPENGGLPAYSAGWRPWAAIPFCLRTKSARLSRSPTTLPRFTAAHNFKMGIEYQHVKFSTLQPAWSRGQFDYNGSFTDIPNSNSSTTGIAQFSAASGAGDRPEWNQLFGRR